MMAHDNTAQRKLSAELRTVALLTKLEELPAQIRAIIDEHARDAKRIAELESELREATSHAAEGWQRAAEYERQRETERHDLSRYRVALMKIAGKLCTASYSGFEPGVEVDDCMQFRDYVTLHFHQYPADWVESVRKGNQMCLGCYARAALSGALVLADGDSR
jgi:hypothetical protein